MPEQIKKFSDFLIFAFTPLHVLLENQPQISLISRIFIHHEGTENHEE
jgi:hypothetical protein